jgi:hypothetical protein
MYRVIKSLERAMSFLKINKGLAFEVEKAGLPPGTKRTWVGKDYIKGQEEKWHHAPKQGQGKEAPAGEDKPRTPKEKYLTNTGSLHQIPVSALDRPSKEYLDNRAQQEKLDSAEEKRRQERMKR